MAFKGIVSCLNASPMVIKLRMVAALQAEGERPVMQATSHISGIRIKWNFLLLKWNNFNRPKKNANMAPICNPDIARMWIVPVFWNSSFVSGVISCLHPRQRAANSLYVMLSGMTCCSLVAKLSCDTQNKGLASVRFYGFHQPESLWPVCLGVVSSCCNWNHDDYVRFVKGIILSARKGNPQPRLSWNLEFVNTCINEVRKWQAFRGKEFDCSVLLIDKFRLKWSGVSWFPIDISPWRKAR